MRSGIDPTVDYAFKKVFGSESTVDLLMNLINAVLQLPPERQIVGLEIRNPFNEKETADDKVSVLDIKAHDAAGRWYNIEMQMIAPWFFPQRVLYYWAKVYVTQLVEGDDYRELRPTISICFVNSRLFPDTDEYHHRFALSDQTEDTVLTDHLEIHLIELPKFTLTAEELTTPLDVWCYFLRHGESLDTARLPEPLNIPPIHRALEVLNVLTQSDIERERYEARLKGLRDQSASLFGAMEEGRKEGREEGLDVGELIGRIRFCQRLLKQRQETRDELASLSLEELTRLAEGLEKQVLPT
jgi:predicted transposase/invertase (TIGR01784 family)